MLHAPMVQFLLGAFCVAFLWAAIFFYKLGSKEEPQAEPTLDPWQHQRLLMEASLQRLPSIPTLHNGSVLYAALMMEELGETCVGMNNALIRGIIPAGRNALAMQFYETGRILVKTATLIREQLKTLQINEPLREDDAVELFDGSIDVAVVNCGFALSCGFPGPAGYAEVVDSNLSKRNPATGMIDKTADGKWIKGPNFYKPDLARILALHRPDFQQNFTDGRVVARAHASGRFPDGHPPKAWVGAPLEEVQKHLDILGK